MANNEILIIPDVHGRRFWRKAMQLVDNYEHIVFLGDYLDPYEWECISSKDAVDGLFDILKFKLDNPDKVTLLLGNHDLHYWWTQGMGECRKDIFNAHIIQRIYTMNRDCFELAYSISTPGKDYLFTHAGVLTAWLEDNKKLLPEDLAEDTQHLSSEEIASWLNTQLDNDGPGLLSQVSIYRGGWDYFGSPVWADCNEHDKAEEQPEFYQIFGHTQQEEYPVITDSWACLDCRKMFVLSTETGMIAEYNDNVL